MKKNIIFLWITLFTIISNVAFAQLPNVALNKPVKQSSIHYSLGQNLFASYAVDGVKKGKIPTGFKKVSLAHTNDEKNPWWQVDLRELYDIKEIRIYPRTHSEFRSRFENIYILTSSTEITSNQKQSNQFMFGPYDGNDFTDFLSIELDKSTRYIRVFRNTDYGILELSEVEVYGTPIIGQNIAQNKTATQSSTYYSLDANRAVDGNTNGNGKEAAMSHTESRYGSWWQVDLGAYYDISKIVIWNRTDDYWERINDFYVMVSESPIRENSTNNEDLFVSGAQSFSSSSEPSKTLTGNKKGRHVRIFLKSNNYLSLAEVEVYGVPVLTNPDIAQNKTATQSSTYYNLDANRAVDGNTNGNGKEAVIAHTKSEPGAWWQVDLGASYDISKIVIWNRTDCCWERINDFYVMVSENLITENSTDNKDLFVPGPQSFSSSSEKSKTLTGNKKGRYVRIFLKSNNYLSLAEVEVFGD